MDEFKNDRMLELSELHIDALQEICNIGMGNTATALSQMIGKQIDLSIPRVKVSLLSDFPDLLGDSESVMAAIHTRIWGDIQGNIMFIFPWESARILCKMLTGTEPDDEFHLSDLHVSALREIGNILGSSYLGALERLLSKSLLPSVPSVAFDMAGAIMETFMVQLGEDADAAVVIRTTFSGDGETLNGHFFLIPDPGSLKMMLQAARVLADEHE